MAQRKKRKKKNSEPTRAELRKILGIEALQKPRINRKKLALEVEKRWKDRNTRGIAFTHHFFTTVSFMLGRIRGKTDMPPTLFDSHRITDEEVGILKLLKAALDLNQQNPETYGEVYNIIACAMGFEEHRKTDGDSVGETKAE